MPVVQVQVVGPEPFQGPLDHPHDVHAREAATTRSSPVGARQYPLLNLGGDDHIVTVALERQAENLLGRLALLGGRRSRPAEPGLVAVGVRRIKEVDAQVQGPMKRAGASSSRGATPKAAVPIQIGKREHPYFPT